MSWCEMSGLLKIRAVCEYEQEHIGYVYPQKWWDNKEEREATFSDKALLPDVPGEHAGFIERFQEGLQEALTGEEMGRYFPEYSPKMWSKVGKEAMGVLVEEVLERTSEYWEPEEVSLYRVEVTVVLRAVPTYLTSPPIYPPGYPFNANPVYRKEA